MYRKLILLFAIILLGLSNRCYSQLMIGANANLLLPLPNFSNVYKSGLGFGVFAKYRTNSQIALGAGYNYNFLFPTGGSSVGVSYNFNKLTAIFEYYFVKASGTPYIGIEPGLYTLTYNIKSTGVTNSSLSESGFGFAPSFGYLYGFAENLSVNFALKYNYVLPIQPNNISNSGYLFPNNTGLSALEINVGIVYAFNRK